MSLGDEGGVEIFTSDRLYSSSLYITIIDQGMVFMEVEE